MKPTKLFITVFCGMLLFPSLIKAQEEIIITKRQHPKSKDNILIINNKTLNDSTAILLFVENAPERFNAPQTPSFALMSKNNKYLMGIGGYVKGTVSMDFNGVIDNPAYFTTSDIQVNPSAGNDKLLQFNANESTLFYNLISTSDSKNKFGATEFYSLDDFNDVRKNALFSKKYLAGFYSAIPHIKEL